MKKIIFLLVLMQVSFVYSAPRRVDVVSIYCKKEVVNGKVFIHRDDLINSERKEVWSVDGKLVSQNDFQEAILDAEKAVRREERRAQEERRKKTQAFKDEMALVLYKKILRLNVDKIDAMLKKFDAHNLENFLAYKEDTFSKELFESLKSELLPEAKRLMYKRDDDFNLSDMHVIVAKVDNLDEKLEYLFQDTVRNAIKQCDDTKVLKDLLELVS